MLRQLPKASPLRGVRELSDRDRDLARVIQRHGPPPLWARRPGFATLVRIILEQQVSLASAEAAYGRLQSVAGRVTPRHVAVTTEARLRSASLTRQKAAYCHTLVPALLAGTLDLAAVCQLSADAIRAIP